MHDTKKKVSAVRFWDSQTKQLRKEAHRMAQITQWKRDQPETTAGGWSHSDVEYYEWLNELLNR